MKSIPVHCLDLSTFGKEYIRALAAGRRGAFITDKRVYGLGVPREKPNAGPYREVRTGTRVECPPLTVANLAFHGEYAFIL